MNTNSRFFTQVVLASRSLCNIDIDWSQHQNDLIRLPLNVDLFPVWFKKDSFVYTEQNIATLISKYAKYFDLWWDPEQISVFEYSKDLCIHCYEHFPKWWNAEEFNYSQSEYLLICWDYKEIWMDNNPHLKPSPQLLQQLILHFSDKFDEWWNPDWYYVRGGLLFVSLLAKHCYEHFDKWWIPSKLDKRHWNLNETDVIALMNYCPEHFDKWKQFLPECIYDEDILEWVAQNHPESLPDMLPDVVDLRTLLTLLENDVPLDEKIIVDNYCEDFIRLVSLLDNETLKKLTNEVLDKKGARVEKFVKELIRRDLYMSTDYTRFSPEEFKWDEGTIVLLTEFADYFDIWWCSDTFPWYRHSKDLCKYLPNKFHEWWNPLKFNDKHYWALIKYCKDYIHVWGNVVFGKFSTYLRDLDEATLERLKLISILDGIEYNNR
ncbi:MAG: hypothetical protein DRN14_05415 [Thermoplasmata archaeon]|nr:MAG: hypothetical protein DRN14_05415 [Thermoplasmata archaeon]